jgi:A118 family predicted phage portal protein
MADKNRNLLGGNKHIRRIKMSLWQSIIGKLKEGIQKMLGANTIESKLNVTVAISSDMEKAINLWNTMYKNKAPWLHEPDDNDPIRIVSLGLPAMIASEKARTALLEFKSEITTPMEEVEVPNPDYKNPPDTQINEWGEEVPIIVSPKITKEQPKTDTSRAEFLNEQYTKLKKHLRTQLEYGIALGGLIIKPYYTEMTIESTEDNKGVEPVDQEAPKKTDEQLKNEAVDKAVFNGKEKPEDTVTQEQPKQENKSKVVPSIEYDFIRADCFYPLAFDANGNITEAAFVQPKVDKQYVYRRLEYHKWENNKLTIINKAYRSSNTASLNNDVDGDFGKEVPLTEVPEWSALQPEIVITDVAKPLFAYFKMPDANIIDMTSPLGVSAFARAISLIKDADMQYSRLLWEYEAGEMALDVDRDAFQWIADTDNSDRGKSKLGKGQQRLYRQVDINTNDGELFSPYAPSLRDANFKDGLNTILMRIEDVTGLSRGTISDASTEAKTATELKILKQRSYQANQDIQQSLEQALKDVIYATNALCDLYEITPPGEYDVNFEWDDSILVDVNEELNKRMALMQQGLMSKLELRQWYFGETERQAKKALEDLKSEAAENMDNDMMGQFTGGFGNNRRTFNNKPNDNKNKAEDSNKEKNDFPFNKNKEEK